MMSNRLMNSNAMSPTPDVDFAFAPMQPYLGTFDAGMSMPSCVDRPLLQLQHHQNLYDNFDFAAAAASTGFPFQESSVLLPLPPPPPSPSMAMAMPSPLQMPPPLVSTAAELYPFASGFLKREVDGPFVDSGAGAGGGRIGLDLGRRTYFSPADVLAVDRLLTRSRHGGGGVGMGLGLGMAGVLGLGLGAAHHHQQQPPRCQAEGCKADLSAAKHYHRRHKVCEYHAKAAAVAAAGKQQRFCQQCSRFHVLAEFDEAKRSCRKRLTEHNRRRRKPASAHENDSSPPPKKADTTSITTSNNSDHKKAQDDRAFDLNLPIEDVEVQPLEEVDVHTPQQEPHDDGAFDLNQPLEEIQVEAPQQGASTAAAKSTAISPNGSGVSCLDMDNGQTSSAAPTALSLAALPLPEKDGGLDTMLMQHVVRGRDGDDDDDEQQRFMTSLVLQAQQHQQQHNGGGNILSCSSVSDQQQNSGCNGFFEVDFI